MLSSSGKSCKNFLLPLLSQLFILNLHSSMLFSQSVLMQLCAENIVNGFTGFKKKKKKKFNSSDNSKEYFLSQPNPGHFSDPIYNIAQQTLARLARQ